MNSKESEHISTEERKKYNKLREIIEEMENVLIAFSGGVDSSFLLKVALDVVGKNNVLAVTANSEIRFDNKKNKAKEIAQKIGAKQITVETSELSKENFRNNNEMRCYFCKYELYQRLKEIAKSKNIKEVLDGTNADDMKNDDRPGLKAIKELNIKTPLEKAGLEKEEIRNLSKELGLPTWNQPSDTCLATRFAYGLKINEDSLNRLEKAENYLRQFEFEQLRVRIHDENTVRIEVLPYEMEKIMKRRKDISQKVKELGFTYITLDLEGYRSGSMGEV